MKQLKVNVPPDVKKLVENTVRLKQMIGEDISQSSLIIKLIMDNLPELHAKLERVFMDKIREKP